MTGSLSAIGSRPTGRDVRPATSALGTADGVAHAVARPVVDGLEASLCGVLVIAVASEDWPAAGDERCEECARIAG